MKKIDWIKILIPLWMILLLIWITHTHTMEMTPHNQQLKALSQMRDSLPHDNHLKITIYEEVPDYKKTEPSEPNRPSTDSNASIDSVSKDHHRKWLIITNMVTGISTAAISAGVSVAIIYLNQKCGTNITTPPQ